MINKVEHQCDLWRAQSSDRLQRCQSHAATVEKPRHVQYKSSYEKLPASAKLKRVANDQLTCALGAYLPLTRPSLPLRACLPVVSSKHGCRGLGSASAFLHPGFLAAQEQVRNGGFGGELKVKAAGRIRAG